MGQIVIPTFNDFASLESSLRSLNEQTLNNIAFVESSNIASQSYSTGDYLTYNGQLYKVTQDITAGEQLLINKEPISFENIGNTTWIFNTDLTVPSWEGDSGDEAGTQFKTFTGIQGTFNENGTTSTSEFNDFTFNQIYLEWDLLTTPYKFTHFTLQNDSTSITPYYRNWNAEIIATEGQKITFTNNITGYNPTDEANFLSWLKENATLVSNITPISIGTDLSNKVNKTGDTMTGDLIVIGDKNVVVQGTNDHNVNPAATRYTPGFYVQDKNGTSAGYMRQYHGTDGTIGLQFETQKYISGTRYRNNIYMGVKATGDPWITMNSPDAWRTALKFESDWRKGTEATSSNKVTVPTSTYTSVASITVPAGVYLLIGQMQYPASATGIRYTSIGPSATAGSTFSVYHGASPTGVTRQNIAATASPSSSTTYYLVAYQNSGSSMTVDSAQLRAIKLG